jgi:hypothetical protein
MPGKYRISADFPPTRAEWAEIMLYEYIAESLGIVIQKTGHQSGKWNIDVLVPLAQDKLRFDQATAYLRAWPIISSSVRLEEV